MTPVMGLFVRCLLALLLFVLLLSLSDYTLAAPAASDATHHASQTSEP